MHGCMRGPPCKLPTRYFICKKRAAGLGVMLVEQGAGLLMKAPGR